MARLLNLFCLEGNRQLPVKRICRFNLRCVKGQTTPLAYTCLFDSCSLVDTDNSYWRKHDMLVIEKMVVFQ